MSNEHQISECSKTSSEGHEWIKDNTPSVKDTTLRPFTIKCSRCGKIREEAIIEDYLGGLISLGISLVSFIIAVWLLINGGDLMPVFFAVTGVTLVFGLAWVLIISSKDDAYYKQGKDFQRKSASKR
jgi:hypothetical protein